MTTVQAAAMRSFRVAYAEQRAAEGRSYTREELLSLPYLTRGPLARQWAVRQRTFDVFMRRVMSPILGASRTPPHVLDLGAGNAWLAYRLALAGCDCTAVDIRDDGVDGLGAAEPYLALAGEHIHRVVGSFESIPVADDSADVILFNASLHYALDFAGALREARRVARPGARIVILDSPFYENVADGEAMVREKHSSAGATFGENAGALLALPSIEYLTRSRLAEASSPFGIEWTHHRVRYPLWYELRALRARMRGKRAPSRFDLWEGRLA